MVKNGGTQVGRAGAGPLAGRLREHSLRVATLTEQMREEAAALAEMASEMEDYVRRQHDALDRIGFSPENDSPMELPRVLQGGPSRPGEEEAA